MTRAQMAVFLLKSEVRLGLRPAAVHGRLRRRALPEPLRRLDRGARRARASPAAAAAASTARTTRSTRAQMAVFLLKAIDGSAYVPPACTGIFTDVPCPSQFADWIEELYPRASPAAAAPASTARPPRTPAARWRSSSSRRSACCSTDRRAKPLSGGPQSSKRKARRVPGWKSPGCERGIYCYPPLPESSVDRDGLRFRVVGLDRFHHRVAVVGHRQDAVAPRRRSGGNRHRHGDGVRAHSAPGRHGLRVPRNVSEPLGGRR